MPAAHVRDYTTEEEVLSIIKTARDEMKAELAVLDKALKSQDLKMATQELNLVWVQANWVRDLAVAFNEGRPRTVKARLEFVKNQVHSARHRKDDAARREASLKKLEAPKKAAKTKAAA